MYGGTYSDLLHRDCDYGLCSKNKQHLLTHGTYIKSSVIQSFLMLSNVLGVDFSYSLPYISGHLCVHMSRIVGGVLFIFKLTTKFKLYHIIYIIK